MLHRNGRREKPIRKDQDHAKILLLRDVRRGKSIRDGRGLAEQSTAGGDGVSFWGGENFLKLGGGDGCTTLNIPKPLNHML